MKRVTIRVPATTANLGPGFDAFGCALSLYTDVTFEETDSGLEITGCDEAYTGPDNLAYTAYCAVLGTLSEEVRGVKIHIDAHIPICRGLGSSAALLLAVALGANVLRGNKLSTQGLLNIRQTPCQSSRREYSPLITFCKLTRTIGTYRYR